MGRAGQSGFQDFQGDNFCKMIGVVYSAFEFEFGFGHVAARDGRRGRELYSISSVVIQWKSDWLALEKCVEG